MYQVDLFQYLILALAAFGASIIGGVTGYGTGLLLPPVLVPIIGAEAVVPVIGLSALLTNASRFTAFRDAFDFDKFKLIVLFALPTTAIGAYGYTLLSGAVISILIGIMLIVLVPLRHLARRFDKRLSGKGIVVAGLGYGLLNGGTAGSGIVLLSILLGAGLSGTAVIATDAAISLVLGIVKSVTFLGAGSLPFPLIIMALTIGFAAIPGAFIAKRFTLVLPGSAHIFILDCVVLLGGAGLIWHGFTS